MNRLFEAFRNLFRIPDLRNRVLFTLALLAVYRIGAISSAAAIFAASRFSRSASCRTSLRPSSFS
jgi:preprotein translocase subunit SecY